MRKKNAKCMYFLRIVLFLRSLNLFFCELLAIFVAFFSDMIAIH